MSSLKELLKTLSHLSETIGRYGSGSSLHINSEVTAFDPLWDAERARENVIQEILSRFHAETQSLTVTKNLGWDEARHIADRSAVARYIRHGMIGQMATALIEEGGPGDLINWEFIPDHVAPHYKATVVLVKKKFK